MNILIIGATGGTGAQLVEQALNQGHHVSAFVRNPAKLQLRHSHLTIIQGDVMDMDSLERAMAGQDAVLSALGVPASHKEPIRAIGTLNVIRAMEKAGVKRFICQTSLGYGDSRQVLNRTPFYFKYLIVPFVLKTGFADHALQEEHIRQSRLDWVIVRPGNLTDGKHTGLYKHGFAATDKTIKVKVSRADVADFMLKQLTTTVYLGKTPGISY
ncbi:NAD(P)-dependent oxidoreductase [Chitinophaga nivalis]|uniref:SDR family oxidoreductase n=1 Tax=Chitinophaga nivalis TaxID=2991709 RepID=A0ABT3ISB8_9BACT|nr:SDR family oxidoreductase [Chitinophaga nivalis]MCW3463524.1 SDR family oxidoreductase [Chitinophaga nivalis]MCW3486786.1 SDR family oxidoreductase [Chitinophaga nivalis]